MNILDENLPRDQVELLRAWRIRCRWTSRDLALQGLQDDEIIPRLLRLSRPTFFSRDSDFYRRELAHARYCLVWLDADVEETAFFIRRVLNHTALNTQAKRMGKVVRVHPDGLEYWTKAASSPTKLDWHA